ncbi:MAG: peptide chain release factor N(5)-glutamine methyltransferase [Spirochaetia bacterium]|nr:peptide chain release factor N(5)-glutamine methyltransferase [Spirochaetia bacterium]
MQEKDTILYVLTKSQEYLKTKGILSPRLDAEILLSELLSLQRIKLYTNFERKLTESEKNLYRDKIKRRGNNEPVAYITGKKSFYKSEFKVNSNVLIPRPETEELLEWILSENSLSNRRVLDLGTGSGCIAISLKLERPDWNVVALDISDGALQIAIENSNQLLGDRKITFLKSDWFSNIEKDRFSIIVSNPPYIPLNEKDSLMQDVSQFEPHLALFLAKPEEFYKMFLEKSIEFLESNGKIYLETHHDWAIKVQDIGSSLGFKTELRQDLNKKNRMVKLTL